MICFGMGLTLREGDREYYYAALDRHFPGLKKKYTERYGNAYNIPSPDERQLFKIFREICSANGIMSTPDECFSFLNDLPERDVQISMF